MKTHFFIIFFAILVLVVPPNASANNGTTKKDVASLLVLIDLSPSMKPHRMKMTKLAPLVKAAMEKSRCEFQVAVGSILYKDFSFSSLTPWAEPGGELWVTQDTPEGPQKIHDRIAFPHDTVHPTHDGDQHKGIPRSGDELTYSSLVESIATNWDQLRDSQVIGTILLTDAVPAYETYTPQEAVNQIKQRLGNIPYLSAQIVADVYSGMMVEPNHLINSQTGEKIPLCGPDHEGDQTPGFMLSTSHWKSKNPDAINQFTDILYAEQWDICEPEYDEKLRKFIESILLVGGCLPVS